MNTETMSEKELVFYQSIITAKLERIDQQEKIDIIFSFVLPISVPDFFEVLLLLEMSIVSHHPAWSTYLSRGAVRVEAEGENGWIIREELREGLFR